MCLKTTCIFPGIWNLCIVLEKKQGINHFYWGGRRKEMYTNTLCPPTFRCYQHRINNFITEFYMLKSQYNYTIIYIVRFWCNIVSKFTFIFWICLFGLKNLLCILTCIYIFFFASVARMLAIKAKFTRIIKILSLLQKIMLQTLLLR